MESVGVAAFLAVVVGAALFAMPCRATVFTVGDTSGWEAATDFKTWLTGKSFQVGDTLDFKYDELVHDVLEVSEKVYDSCEKVNDAINSNTDGNTQIPLTSTGTRYFICAKECANGMKIAVHVIASTSPASSDTPFTSTTNSPSTDENAATAVSVTNVGLISVGAFVMVAGIVL